MVVSSADDLDKLCVVTSQAVANSTTPNGVYTSTVDSFPQNSFNATNYWVDLLFVATG